MIVTLESETWRIGSKRYVRNPWQRHVVPWCKPIRLLKRKVLSNYRVETARTRTPLCNLPLDILLSILALLDIEALLVCKKVCRLFRHLVETDVYLQYKIELGVNGLIEGPASEQLPVFKRLAKLRERSARLCSADFSCELDYKLGRDSDLERTLSVVSTWNPSSGSSVSYRLIGIQARQWTLPLPRVRDVVAVDASQDLVIVQETTGQDGTGSNSVHILSMEQWPAAHPQAAQGVLEVFPQTTLQIDHPNPPHGVSALFGVLDARICGRYLAWNVRCHDDHETNALEVWDWHLGCRVWHGHFHIYASYTFVDDEHLAVIDYEREDELLVYRFAGATTHVPCTPLAHRHVRPASAVRFKLPLGAHWCNIRDSCAPPSSTPPPSAIFWPDQQHRVVALDLSITRCGDSPDSWFIHCPCILLVPHSTFRKHLDACASASTRRWSNTSAPAVVKWDTWGPHGSLLLQNTRILTRKWDSFQPVQYHPFGSRICMLEEEDMNVRLVTYDLNPWARMHQPHAGCCKLEGKSKLEDFSAYQPDFRPTNRTTLETSLSRTFYRGPLLENIDRPYAMITNQDGFTVVCKNEFARYDITGFQTYHL